MNSNHFYGKNAARKTESHYKQGQKSSRGSHWERSEKNGSSGSGRGERERKVLPDNRLAALAELHINPTAKLNRDETVYFQLYLNYAVNNICKIANIADDVTSDGVVNAIKEKAGNIRKLANFFWLFQADEPEKNYPDYEKFTLAIAQKIFELREYFTHLNENDVSPLVADQTFYRFVGGVLASQALEASVKPGMKSAKLFKMKLFSVRNKEEALYEFTRKGIVFLTCLALYKDDAQEFTQCLQDMKIPSVCPQNQELLGGEECGGCEDISTCRTGVARAFISMFTYFSSRRGRSVNLLADDMNYMAFADIIGYLNKVPSDAALYLTLEKEVQMLREKAELSTESEENKKFKYSLHKRHRERFISLAAAYCEDFNVFRSLKFKRLDTSENMGRKRYTFGAEQQSSEHRDRLYHIENSALRFSWEPSEHYGQIHIASLRSAVSSRTLKELLFAAFSNEPADRELNTYFAAYHKILETMINTPDTGDLVMVFEKLLPEFSAVSGFSGEEIRNNISLLNGFFPENLLRFFRQEPFKFDNGALREALVRKIELQITHSKDFLVRLGKMNKWKEELGKLREKDPEVRLPQPVCDSKDVSFPPRSCNISEGALIARVFDYFNLYLENDQKFRQLPPGEQHRGELDFEYQTVHALIGKYTLDPQGLKYFIENKKKALLPAWEPLQKEISLLRQKAMEKRPPKYNKFNKPIKPPATLWMLAEAALKCSIRFLEGKLELWRNSSTADNELLHKTCRRFGLRPGMPLDWNSLIKTVLHIDPGPWMHAFDQENGANYENRSLEQHGHIVTQIPLPGDMAHRIMLKSRNPNMKQYIKSEGAKKNSFDFGAAVRAMPVSLALRDYYDVTPLAAANIALQKNGTVGDISGLKTAAEEGGFPPDLSRNAVKKAIAGIKEARHQDLLLAQIAWRYWESFQAGGAFICRTKADKGKVALTEKPSVYDYFNASAALKFDDAKDDRIIVIMPNDVNRPILSQIRKYAPVIARSMDETGTQREFEFYEMLKEYRQIQVRDRQKKLACIPLLNQFANAVRIPGECYIKGDTLHNRKMEFEHYSKVFRELSEEEYNTIVSLRNKVFHDGLDIDLKDLESLLKKYVSLPAPRENFKKEGRWKKRY